MEFSPKNPVVKLCLQGLSLEENGQPDAAVTVFVQAWSEASNDHEKFLTSYHLARRQRDAAEQLKWFETALQFASKVNDSTVQSAFSSLYAAIAKCHAALNNPMAAKRNHELASSFNAAPSDQGPFFHGTKADLRTGDLLKAGGNSNYQSDLAMNHVYFTALANGAGLAATLAKGAGLERVYIVEPTGEFEDDPNVTNKKFPGNPTRSYRSRAPLRIVGEKTDWVRPTSPEREKWREKLASTKGKIIN